MADTASSMHTVHRAPLGQPAAQASWPLVPTPACVTRARAALARRLPSALAARARSRLRRPAPAQLCPPVAERSSRSRPNSPVSARAPFRGSTSDEPAALQVRPQQTTRACAARRVCPRFTPAAARRHRRYGPRC
ncbi:hypothetical protein SORBI_3007G072166 [Sorghum bicolor]|uniref:Uncharacterized protein n=1 Tax=Sorghum bicolor TaxID=4558 RepID=A0A1Z5R8E9_SORBI|nr:hypothetical protein SORBI_3007G072166 [Sorghum bicolor]